MCVYRVEIEENTMNFTTKHKQHYSIRKFTVGAASVLIGTGLYIGLSQTAIHAEEVTPAPIETVEVQEQPTEEVTTPTETETTDTVTFNVGDLESNSLPEEAIGTSLKEETNENRTTPMEVTPESVTVEGDKVIIKLPDNVHYVENDTITFDLKNYDKAGVSYGDFKFGSDVVATGVYDYTSKDYNNYLNQSELFKKYNSNDIEPITKDDLKNHLDEMVKVNSESLFVIYLKDAINNYNINRSLTLQLRDNTAIRSISLPDGTYIHTIEDRNEYQAHLDSLEASGDAITEGTFSYKGEVLKTNPVKHHLRYFVFENGTDQKVVEQGSLIYTNNTTLYSPILVGTESDIVSHVGNYTTAIVLVDAPHLVDIDGYGHDKDVTYNSGDLSITVAYDKDKSAWEWVEEKIPETQTFNWLKQFADQTPRSSDDESLWKRDFHSEEIREDLVWNITFDKENNSVTFSNRDTFTAPKGSGIRMLTITPDFFGLASPNMAIIRLKENFDVEHVNYDTKQIDQYMTITSENKVAGTTDTKKHDLANVKLYNEGIGDNTYADVVVVCVDENGKELSREKVVDNQKWNTKYEVTAPDASKFGDYEFVKLVSGNETGRVGTGREVVYQYRAIPRADVVVVCVDEDGNELDSFKAVTQGKYTDPYNVVAPTIDNYKFDSVLEGELSGTVTEDGQKIVLQYVLDTHEEPIPFDTVYVGDNTIPFKYVEISYDGTENVDDRWAGKPRVTQEGKTGTRVVDSKGNEISRTDPTNKIITVPTLETRIQNPNYDLQYDENAPKFDVDKTGTWTNKEVSIHDALEDAIFNHFDQFSLVQKGHMGEAEREYQVDPKTGELSNPSEWHRPVSIPTDKESYLEKLDFIYGYNFDANNDVSTPFKTIYVYDDTLEAGQTIVDQEGKDTITHYTLKNVDIDKKNFTAKLTRSTSVDQGQDRIIRVGVKPKVEKEDIPYTTIYQEDPNLEAGKTEVVQEGKTGTRTTTTTYTMKEDGTVVENTPTVDTEDKVDHIIKVGVQPKVEKEDIPYTTIYQEDPTLEAGKTEVVQEGKTGTRTTTTTYMMNEDGTVVENTTTVDTVEKVDQIILVGTKENAPTPTKETKVEKETISELPKTVSAQASAPLLDAPQTGVETSMMPMVGILASTVTALGTIIVRKKDDKD